MNHPQENEPHKFTTHHTYTGQGCAMCGGLLVPHLILRDAVGRVDMTGSLDAPTGGHAILVRVAQYLKGAK